MKNILVVDDDPHIRDVICFALEKANYRPISVSDGAQAINAMDASPADLPDLIILDIGLPEMDGLEVCRTVRKTSDVPILFLSARSDEIDRILGLEIGGDDYVTKPFSPRELIARIGVILRRTTTTDPDNGNKSLFQHGVVILDSNQHLVTVNAQPVSLTTIEFAILKTFLNRPGMVFTRDQILNAAYKQNMHVSDRTIDSHIRNIRSKMSKAKCNDAVETVHGTGFRLGPCQQAK